MKKTILSIALLSLVGVLNAQVKVSYVSLADNATVSAEPIKEYSQPANFENQQIIRLYPDTKFQTIIGIGGCFNEIGGEALSTLSKKQQNEILTALFSEDNGAGFEFCRMSIGSSDFGIDDYSFSETPGDYKMEHFTMERESKYMMPYIQSAVAVNPKIKIFGSPWSPPAWMKHSGYMDRGDEFPETNMLIDEPRIYNAYALYFAKYVEAYKEAGVDIERIVIQNEQDLNTKYPSCRMPVDQMVKFVRNYLRPTLEQREIDTEIWAGTFRTARENPALEFAGNKDNMKGFDGIGIQYTHPKYVHDIHYVAPDTRIMHTESNCHDGANTIKQARTRFSEVADYINGGSENFCYWNMILNETGKSGWDWRQNALVSIDRTNKSVTYTPDFATMALLSRFMRPNSVRIASFCGSTIISVAYYDKYNVILENKDDKAKQFKCIVNGQEYNFEIPAESLSAIEIPKL